jgi:sec-independent protein translocase protein TatA
VFGVGTWEIVIVLLVMLLLFGSKELPQNAKKIAKGLRDIQRTTQHAKDEIRKIIEEEDPPKPPLKG